MLQHLIVQPTIQEMVIKRQSFESNDDFTLFLSKISTFESRLQKYFADYCKINGLESLLNEKNLFVKGYYVEHKKWHNTKPNDDLLIIYTHLQSLSNKDAVTGLYRWEEKLNELRTSCDSNGLQETSG